jgi:hypothetical protein
MRDALRTAAGTAALQKMNRNITGTIRKTDGTVWAGAVLEFELERSSFDDDAQYPVRAVRAVANNVGELNLSLWANDDAPRPTRYICTLPDGSQFRFTLPEDGSAIDLSELRETAVEDDSPRQSDLIAFLPVMRQTIEDSLTEISSEIAAKADQTALDALSDGLETANDTIALKASQSALNTTNTNVQDLTDEVAALSETVDVKANQSALDTTNSSLSSLSTVVATKAAQSGLNTTNSNLQMLTSNVSDLSDLIDTKADESALTQTNSHLSATMSDLADLGAVVETKAAQSALDTAIGDLQDAIAQAQSTLQDLIDQKADADHTHSPENIVGGTGNSVAVFDVDGILGSTASLTFRDNKIGFGANDPSATVDLNNPNESGYHSRVTLNLDSPFPDLRLISDTSLSEPGMITFDSNGYTTSISGGTRGELRLGTSEVTTEVVFQLANSETTYLGRWIDDGLGSNPFDSDGFFGFIQTSHSGLKLVFNLGGSLYSVNLEDEGFIGL